MAHSSENGVGSLRSALRQSTAGNVGSGPEPAKALRAEVNVKKERGPLQR